MRAPGTFLTQPQINPNTNPSRIWSIVPALYVWIFALHPLFALGEGSPADLPFDRLTVMAALTTLWCVF